MTVPLRPVAPKRAAAYIRLASGPGALSPARQRKAIVEAARQRGWPKPAVYADSGPVPAEGYSPALAKLSAAIGAGRHDAVIMPGPGVISRSPADLMVFLFRCSHHRVAVEFVSPAGEHAFLTCQSSAAPDSPPFSDRYGPQFPPPSATETADVLTRAGVEALSGLFAAWRIWADEHGWHARRRDDGYLQAYQHGAPAFCVHAVSATELAAQLRWQQAADIHAPAGCPSG
jgi:hypothetical protein